MLKLESNRAKLSEMLSQLMQGLCFKNLKLDYEKIREEMNRVRYCNGVIIRPKDNQNEPFKFSSRHSEFIQL